MQRGAAIVGQSGGPTAVINASLAGIIKASLEIINSGGCISAILGMKNGIDGLLNDEVVDLSEKFNAESLKSQQDLSILSMTPSSALGSCRHKLPPYSDNPEIYSKILSEFVKYDIRYMFYIGGNDSMDSVKKLNDFFSSSKHKAIIIGVPKTIDNDLTGTDHAPGYGSASKYIATTLSEIVHDCSVYSRRAVTIVEIMGRSSGWLSAAAGLSRLNNDKEVDYIYFPECCFSLSSFLGDIEVTLSRKPNVVIAVSEGLKYSNGKYVGDALQSGAIDVFGHRYLSGTAKALEMEVKKKFGCKVRSVELNISQRCASHIMSETDYNEAFAVGRAAVEAAMYNSTGTMISITRNHNKSLKYGVTYETVDINEIANKTKTMPSRFINSECNNVTDECLEYIAPLIKGEVHIPYKNGIPVHYDL